MKMPPCTASERALELWNRSNGAQPRAGGRMATASGIWNQPMATAASPMATTTNGASSSGSSATISANDFLTLLVTEMQNQDPTADTDPNEYINQLVQVNSLEQLIDINQTLSTGLGGASGGSSPSGQVTASNPGAAANASTQAASQQPGSSRILSALSSLQSVANGPAGAGGAPAFPSGIKQTPGNLGIPEAQPAAHRIANSLAGHSRTR